MTRLWWAFRLAILNPICKIGARNYLPKDDDHEFASALFNWKYRN